LPSLTGIIKVKKGDRMIHKKVSSRRSGELWTLKCSCGRRWHSERWHCKESFTEHLPFPFEDPHADCHDDGSDCRGNGCPCHDLWWDEASYLKYQSMP